MWRIDACSHQNSIFYMVVLIVKVLLLCLAVEAPAEILFLPVLSGKKKQRHYSSRSRRGVNIAVFSLKLVRLLRVALYSYIWYF